MVQLPHRLSYALLDGVKIMLSRSLLFLLLVVLSGDMSAGEPEIENPENAVNVPDALDEARNSGEKTPSRANRRDMDSPRRVLERKFDQLSPPIGSPLPDVSAFDADGNALNLASLRGNYTVLVFGCLT
jgi:cytochrome oxidase Cu insertion factor (SCO1/SenC/PrrC family)